LFLLYELSEYCQELSIIRQVLVPIIHPEQIVAYLNQMFYLKLVDCAK